MAAAAPEAEQFGREASGIAPSFEAAKLAQKKPSTPSYLVSLEVGAFAAVHWRPNVTKTWTPCVLRRSADGRNCLVFLPSTSDPVETLPIGLNDNGTPIDGGVEAEWSMTITGFDASLEGEANWHQSSIAAEQQAPAAAVEVEVQGAVVGAFAGDDYNSVADSSASTSSIGLSGAAVSAAVSAAIASVLGAATSHTRTVDAAAGEVVDVTGGVSAGTDETSVRVGVRYRLSGQVAPVFVWHVNVAQNLVAVVSDDTNENWKAIPRAEFTEAAVVERRDTAQDVANWLSSELLMPHSLPVEQVIFAAVSGHHKKKCPAGALRGRYIPVAGLDGAAVSMKEGWELFLAYTPGGYDSNFADSPLKFPVVAGQWLECNPPFILAVKGESSEAEGADEGVSVPISDVMGQLLGILVGKEEWCSLLKDGERKSKSEFRRFCLVEVAGMAYFVQFDKLTCKHDPSRPRASVQHCIAQCVNASHKTRKPASIAGALNTAAKRLKIALENEENRAAVEAAANAANAADTTAAGIPGVEHGRRTSARQTALQLQQAESAAATNASGQCDTAPTATPASTPASTLPPSGVPLGLHNFGVARLDPLQDLSQLLLALKENGINAELPAGELNPILWAKNELWRKFKRRNYPGWRDSSAASEASVSVTTADSSTIADNTADDLSGAARPQPTAGGRGAGGRGSGAGGRGTPRRSRGGARAARVQVVEVEDEGSEEGSEESSSSDNEDGEESGEESDCGDASGRDSAGVVETQAPQVSRRQIRRRAPEDEQLPPATRRRCNSSAGTSARLGAAPAAATAEVSDTRQLLMEMRSRIDAQERALASERRRRFEAEAQAHRRAQIEISSSADAAPAAASGVGAVTQQPAEAAERPRGSKKHKKSRRKEELKLHSDESTSDSSSSDDEIKKKKGGKGTERKVSRGGRSSSSSANSSDSEDSFTMKKHAVQLAELDADSSVERKQEVRARARKRARLMQLIEYVERKRAKKSKKSKKKTKHSSRHRR